MMTEIKVTTRSGFTSVTLSNEKLEVVLLPVRGGKTVSIFHKEKGFELTAQHPEVTDRQPDENSAFEDFEAAGIDDAFPTINTGKLPGEKFSYTDHGEIWRSPFQWEVEKDGEQLHFQSDVKKDGVRLHFHSDVNHYDYEKWVSLQDETVKYHYRITNTGEESFPCLWTFHGLMKYEEDMVLLFPGKLKRVLNVYRSAELGEDGQIWTEGTELVDSENGQSRSAEAEAVDPENGRVFAAEGDPTGKRCYDFAHVPPAAADTALKYWYTDPNEEGWCGFRYPSEDLQCTIRYDAAKLPWLGFWVTVGAFRGDYNCSWEPSNGFYDGIETAQRNGKLTVLEPGKSMEFRLEISLRQENG